MRMEASRELLLQKMLKAANDARLSYLKAIHAARNRDFDKAKNLMNEYLERYPGDEAALRENEFLKTR